MLTTLDPRDALEHDPDRQAPMPFKAAEDYARTVMAWARQPLPASVHACRDIAYGPHRLHRYNVFCPSGAKNAPVVLCWHGGGWTNGYRDYVTFMATNVTAMGCVLIAPSYRLAPADPLPAAFEDALLALRHVSLNVNRFGGDGHRIYLTGHSAGAHLATLVALRAQQNTHLDAHASVVRGCLPVSGIMDLHHPTPAPGSLEERVYSMVLDNQACDAVMSPICWTKGNDLPFAISFGEQDSDRVQKSNRRLAELLKLQSGSVEMQVMTGQDHFKTHTSLRNPCHPWYRSLANMS